MKKNFSNLKNKLSLIRPENAQNRPKAAINVQPCVKICRLESFSRNCSQKDRQHRFIVNELSLKKKQRTKAKTYFNKTSLDQIPSKTNFSTSKLENEAVEKTNNLGCLQLKKPNQQPSKAAISKFLSEMQEKKSLVTKNNLLQISFTHMSELLAQFSRNMSQSRDNYIFSHSNSSLQNVIKTNIKSSLSLNSAFSQQFLLSKSRNMQYSLQVIDFFVKFEPIKRESQIFWALVQKFQKSDNTQAQLIFLLQKLKYLHEQLSKKNDLLKQLSVQNYQLQALIQQRTSTLAAVQAEIGKKQTILDQINIKANQINEYLTRQPNKILEAQAKQYKARQQQLFDLAFMLQESTPQRIITWIGGQTNISDKCFRLTINEFFSKLSSQSNSFSITRTELQRFRSSIQFSYNKVTQKLEEIIESRFAKIKEFVAMMQKLASYTVGKREYLDQANFQMAIVKVKLESEFQKIQQELQQHIHLDFQGQQSLRKSWQDLKVLVKSIEKLYMKTQVFY